MADGALGDAPQQQQLAGGAADAQPAGQQQGAGADPAAAADQQQPDGAGGAPPAAQHPAAAAGGYVPVPEVVPDNTYMSRETRHMERERAGELTARYITNDGAIESGRLLIGLKNVFSKVRWWGPGRAGVLAGTPAERHARSWSVDPHVDVAGCSWRLAPGCQSSWEHSCRAWPLGSLQRGVGHMPQKVLR